MQNNERSVRSVFVGNIPYDATEEKLKDIFSEVGPVVSFRLVYDRDTGKPKGYGFCEYRDQETAMSAMRNLSGFELNGRTLRVDNAANENAKEQMRNLQQPTTGSGTPTPFESGGPSTLSSAPEMESENAPEAIGKAVASLPPEQMFELAKQMKQCIVTNPNEARNMLIQNPQLCYGLLHALVAMRVVEPNVAVKMLHRPQQTMKPGMLDSTIVAQQQQTISNVSMNPVAVAAASSSQPTTWNPTAGTDQFGRMTQPPIQQPVVPVQPIQPNPGVAAAGSYDPRMYGRNAPPANTDPRIRPHAQLPFDPRLSQQQINRNVGPNPNFAASLAAASQPGVANADQMKADLIMQVLHLSDEQIARFTPEQQNSIMLIKQQMQSNNG